MAYTAEQLQQLKDLSSQYGGFQSDEFKTLVNTKMGEGSYDKLAGNLQTQYDGIKNKQSTQNPTQINTPQQPITQQNNITQANTIQTPQNANNGGLNVPTQKQAISTPPKPVETPKVTQTQVQTPNIDWKNISIDDWKKQTGGGMQNLEQLVENKYGTIADIKGDTLTANIGGTNYQWKLDQAGNPIKTIAPTPQQQAQQEMEQKQITDQQKQNVGFEFEKLLNAGVGMAELNAFYKNNLQYQDVMKPLLLNHFKNKDNVAFYKKYSTYNAEELFNAYKNGEIIVGDEKYNLLPQDLRDNFQEYKRYEENKTTGTSFSFQDMNNKVVDMNDILTKVKEIFSTNIRKEYEEKMNSPEMSKLKEEMTNTSKQIGDLDNTIKNLEDDIRAKYPGVSEGTVQALIRKEQKDLYKKRDDLVTTYNSKAQMYSMNKEELQYSIELSKYEDSINRENFKTALQMYNTERERMDVQEQRDFEVKQAELTAQRQLENQKALITFQEEIGKEKGGEYVDDGKGNLTYVKNGKIISTLSGLGKPVSKSSTDLNDYKIYENDDGSFTSFNVDKKTGKLTQQTFDINGGVAGGYINTIGTGKITSYGGTHDNYTGLDIDGKIGDPIYSPLSGTVLSVDNYGDKAYGKSVLVQLSDGTKARFSHLNTQDVKKGQTFEQGSLLGTIGNTGYVQKVNGGDGSHLDLVTYDSNGKARSSKVTEQYIKSLTMRPEKQDTAKVLAITQGLGGTAEERKEIQNAIINRATKNGISLEQAKKELGYKSGDDVQFSKIRESEYSNIKQKSRDAVSNADITLNLLSKPKNAVGDVASVVGFLKTIDPSSVARESEVQSVEKARGVIEGLSNTFAKLKDGTVLTDKQREQIKSAVQTIKNAADRKYSEYVLNTVKEYNDRGLDPTVVFPPSEITKAKQLQKDSVQIYKDSSGLGYTKKDLINEINRMVREKEISKKEADSFVKQNKLDKYIKINL